MKSSVMLLYFQNQRTATMRARTTLGTHNPIISAQTVTRRLPEIGERPPIYNVCIICGVSFLV